MRQMMPAKDASTLNDVARQAASRAEWGAARDDAPAAESLAIAGLVPLSTVDWPGKLVATVFLQGCPLACPYCQNEAILDPKAPGTVRWSRVEALLARRAGLLDGVVLTGGEALRQAGVVDAARRVREYGFGVGLHTAGAYPRALTKVLPHIDWVGIDVKAMPEDYAAATGFGAGVKAWRSLDIVLEAAEQFPADPGAIEGERTNSSNAPGSTGFDYEVRTTVYPGAPAAERFEELLGELRARGVRNFALQEARSDGTPVAFRAQALAWDRRAWAKRLAEMVDAANTAGFESFEARLA